MIRLYSLLLRRTCLLMIATLISWSAIAGNYDKNDPIKPVKNVILMISDGTSLPTISLTRWYKRTLDSSQHNLHLDPYLCGTILTYCSNAPIGDSAPTTSCFMTGIPSIEKFVATYPYSAGKDDLIPVDSTRAYCPAMTLMEATRIAQNRRTGIVVTSHFTDATPADCASHSYARRRYDWIAKQLAHNQVDVLMGGGNQYLTKEEESYLKGRGYGVFRDNKEALTSYAGNKIWALYGDHHLEYDLDRDATTVPSLAELTDAAIKRLDNENGFMLMVEGSKVDWAAHANDPVGIVTEFRAFDDALKVALDFAERDGNTVVIVTSDHGNSGISIGRQSFSNYSSRTQEELFGQLCRVRKTAEGMADIMQRTPFAEVRQVFLEETGMKLTDQELEELKHVKGYKMSPLSADKRKEMKDVGPYSNSLAEWIGYIYRKHIPMGFTTHGHTGEEVFLAIYAPKATPRLVGFNTNVDLFDYMQALLGLTGNIQDYTDTYYAPCREVFAGMQMNIKGDKPMDKILEVRKGGHQLTFTAFSSEVLFDGKTLTMPTPAVYVDKTDQFYINKNMVDLLNGTLSVSAFR